ncbi:sugar phosphate isomerase/epimerase family protein [Rhodoferax aquaticus]|uniref:Sugar phosphate isomerase/epimerase n=1 Tax=Rhodoferax aquaticus TaxID=2527691 RepID=A0A515ERG4_9BURK|nr:TIM barrel protein [Rhodoferax aquaticus]QDL55228.1 sugar phosphate isomerase/epimerase [Rhodoferax aquaticus]
MRIAISNIAWDVSEDEQVVALLNKYGVDAIDVAPSKYFPDPKNARPGDIARVREWWRNGGIEITGMQALLFGTTGLNLFGSQNTQAALLEHLQAVCGLGAGLGAKKLVFGSPKNRDRSALSNEVARDMAIRFFRRLGDVASCHGVVICLEPNPPCYGANFMTDSAETASVVGAVDHPAIRMQLDTGAMAINGEDVAQVISEHAALIGHVHASEPDLATLGDGCADHSSAASQLRARVPDQVVTIEMLPPKAGANIAAIERALAVAICYYRDQPVGMAGAVA